MQVDFNPSRLSKVGAGRPVVYQNTLPAPAAPAAVPEKADLEQKLQYAPSEPTLQYVPSVRPEKIAQASAHIVITHYPPDELLDRIAVLFAIHWNG